MITVNIECVRDYSKLFQLCKGDVSSLDLLEINLSRLVFVNTFDVLILCQVCIWMKNYNPDIRIVLKGKGSVFQYIQDIGLIDFCKSNYEQPRTIKFIEKNTAMPIRRVDEFYLTEYILTTLRFIKNYCAGKDLSMLNVVIAEAINNVYDHSHSRIGAYVFCQYLPNKKIVKVCVADMGIGIPENVKRINPHFNDMQCIEWAIGEKNSTKSVRSNAGLGLTNLNDFLIKNYGVFRIYSGSGHYKLLNGKVYLSENTINDFIGTLIDVEINVQNLDEEDNENFTF